MKIKLICSLVFILLFAAIGFGQADKRYTKLRFEYKKGLQTKSGTVNYSFWQDSPSGGPKIPVTYLGKKKHQVKLSKAKNNLYLSIKDFKPSDKKRKLVIKNSCITVSGVAKHKDNFYEINSVEKRKREPKPIQIPFIVTGNGKGEVRVSFDVVVRDSDDHGDWDCGTSKNATIVFEFEASGFREQIEHEENPVVPIVENDDNYEPQPQLTIEQEWENVDKERQEELCAFYKKYSSRSQGKDAKKKLKKFDEKAWSTAEEKNTVAAYRKYLYASDNCLRKYKGEARKRIGTFEKDGDLNAKWEELKEGKNKEAVFNFFLEQDDFKNEVLTFYKNNFSSLGAELQTLKANQSYVITVRDSIFEPRYQDISLDEGIKIDDGLWSDSGILRIELLQKGSYEIYVQDSIGRDTAFGFGYTFEAKGVDEDEVYEINIEGGVPPFEIKLYDDENKATKFTKVSTDRTIKLDKTEIAKQDIYGSFQVAVKHAKDGLDKITLKESLVLKKTTSINWLTVFVWLICIALLAFSVWFYWKERKRRLSYINA